MPHSQVSSKGPAGRLWDSAGSWGVPAARPCQGLPGPGSCAALPGSGPLTLQAVSVLPTGSLTWGSAPASISHTRTAGRTALLSRLTPSRMLGTPQGSPRYRNAAAAPAVSCSPAHKAAAHPTAPLREEKAISGCPGQQLLWASRNSRLSLSSTHGSAHCCRRDEVWSGTMESFSKDRKDTVSFAHNRASMPGLRPARGRSSREVTPKQRQQKWRREWGHHGKPDRLSPHDPAVEKGPRKFPTA